MNPPPTPYSGEQRVPIVVANAADRCHRCAGELYLTATIPEPDLPLRRLVVLCPRCDSSNPAAQGLLAFMAIHGKVDEATFDQFQELVSEWLAAPHPRGVDEQTLDRDIEEWLRDQD